MNPSTEQQPEVSSETVWEDFVRAYPVIDADEAGKVMEVFGKEMSSYTELLSGPQGTPAGLMVRGQGEEFCARARTWMADWGVSEQNLQYFGEMAELFKHTNVFFKLEWHPNGQRLAATYFRRRPPVRRILHHFHKKGISPEVLKHILWISNVLQKDSIHFVSAAFRAGSPPRHKLYFSQAIRPDTWADVVHRTLTLMAHFRIQYETRNLFLQLHPQLAPVEKSSTLFVAFSFDQDGLHPSFKLDYPGVSPAVIQQLAAESDPDAAFADLCTRVQADSLSYLGLRLYPNKPLDLKYYADHYG